MKAETYYKMIMIGCKKTSRQNSQNLEVSILESKEERGKQGYNQNTIKWF